VDLGAGQTARRQSTVGPVPTVPAKFISTDQKGLAGHISRARDGIFFPDLGLIIYLLFIYYLSERKNPGVQSCWTLDSARNSLWEVAWTGMSCFHYMSAHHLKLKNLTLPNSSNTFILSISGSNLQIILLS
jgi:hypothetical protein